MIEVELPDGRVIEFPEGTPPEVMQRVAREAMGQAPQQAAPTAIPGAQPGFIEQLQGATREVQAPMQAPPQVNRDIWKDTSLPYRLAADIRGGAARGAAALGGLPNLLLRGIEQQGAPPFGLKSPLVSALRKRTASSEEIERGLERTFGRGLGVRKEPSGPTGRLLGGTYEFLGAGVGPRVAALSGAGASALGEPTRILGVPEYEPYARLAGALIGGATSTMTSGPRAAAAKEIREATRGITPREWRAAQATQTRARQAGIPLSGPEALATRSDAPIATLASYVATSPHGSLLSQTLARRPGLIKRTLETAARRMAPGAPQEPAAIAARGAQAAQSRINRAGRARTARTSRYFERAAESQIRQADAQGIIRRIDRQLQNTAPNTAVHRELTRLRDMINENRRIGPLNDYFKNLRDVRFKERPGATDTLSRTEQAQLRPVLTRLQAALGRGSQDYRTGRKSYRELSRRLVDPLVQGPVQQVAKAGGPSVRAVAPEADASINRVIRQMREPSEIGPSGIAQLASNMNRQDTRAFPALARRYFEDSMESAFKRIQGAPVNPQGGTNFAKTVFGDKLTRANTNAVLRGVAQAHGVNANAYVRGWRNFFRTLDRTGRIPAAGSLTQPRGAVQQRLGTAPIQKWRDRFIQFKLDVLPRNTRELARIMTDERSVELMMRLSRLQPESRQAQAIMGALIAPLLELEPPPKTQSE